MPNNNGSTFRNSLAPRWLTIIIVLGVALAFFWLREGQVENRTGDEAALEASAMETEAEQSAPDEADTQSAEASGASETNVEGEETVVAVAPASDAPALEPRAGPPGMPTITLNELPPEALDTIALIESDGPFPYSKDGSTFQNREGLLPDEPMGYYSEYTVETPGSPDRGARRIVGGADSELYYTDDHYESFSWIILE